MGRDGAKQNWLKLRYSPSGEGLIKEGHWLLVFFKELMETHLPVMPKEVIKFLAPQTNENFIDATIGFGGHSQLILEKTAPFGKLLAIDQDIEAINFAQKKLKKFSSRVDFIKENFTELGLICRSWKVDHLDGILFDLGVSTYQLLAPKRGFSFQDFPQGKNNQKEVSLDMRMSPDTQSLTAAKIVNSWSKKELKKLLQRLGEEPYAGKIASAIINERNHQPIIIASHLVEVIKRALPPKYRHKRQKHFATSTFRALRMAVNRELEVLESGLKQAVPLLSRNGRLVVISFHSLEDRIVKNFFRENSFLNVLTPKPVTASEKEIAQNPRARSGKLRAAIKL